MKRASGIFILFLYLFILWVHPVEAQTENEPILKSPRAGEALQGVVTINGSNNIDGFESVEVAFTYTGDTTGTWFTITTNNQPVNDGLIATWDTTTISDGNYVLRMRIFTDNGSFQDVRITNLRVRNYTPIETPTPAPTAVQPTAIPTITLTPTLFPTPTQLPTNAAILTPTDVSISLGYGGVAAVLLLAIIGVYLWLRRKV